MELEQQVVSLELSKKLKELGVPQDSLFYWWATDIEIDGLTWWEVGAKEPKRGKAVRRLEDRQPVSAFSVAELGEMLPNKIGDGYWIITGKDKDGWFCAYNKPQGGKANYIHLVSEETEADARAKMLIWLVENRYLDFKNSVISLEDKE